MVKWLFLFTLVLTSCVKKEDPKSKVIKLISETKNVDVDLWEIKVITLDKTETTTKLIEKEVCNKYNVIYTIELKENCYESKSILEENLITAQLMKVLEKDDPIYKPGKCYTLKDVEHNLAEVKKESLAKVGQKMCLSYKHILQGGGCSKEVEITPELVEENFQRIAVKAKQDLNKENLHLAGEQIVESLKIELCDKN